MKYFKVKSFSYRSFLITLFFIFFFTPAISTVIFCVSPAYSDSHVLSWEQGEGADYYQVYMRLKGSSTCTPVSGHIPSNTTTFRFTPPSDGAVCYFSVKAFTDKGNSSDLSEEVQFQADTLKTTPPPDITEEIATPHIPVNLGIILPSDGDIITAGSSVGLSADVHRGSTVLTKYTVTWTSTIDGSLGTGLDISVRLTTGIHIIMASCNDESGETASDSILLCVQELTNPHEEQAAQARSNKNNSTEQASAHDNNSAVTGSTTITTFNNPPVIDITDITGGIQNTTGQIFELKAEASDKEDGVISKKITWSSDKDGYLGQGGLIKPHLSDGTHIISATVKDSKDKKTTENVTVVSCKTPCIDLVVTTQRIFSMRLVYISWSGASSGVDIYMDNVKKYSGPCKGACCYWLKKKTVIKACDSLNPSISATKETR